MKEDNQGLRFLPTRRTITVYDETGQLAQRFAADELQAAFWCDMQFAEDGTKLVVWPHSWKCRGLAGQPTLPADDHADTLYVLDVASGKAQARSFPPAVSDVAVSEKGALAVGSWGGLYRTQPEESSKTSGARLVRFSPDGAELFVADTRGIVRDGKGRWQTDLNTAVPTAPKPWVANARATPIVPGVWQIPG